MRKKGAYTRELSADMLTDAGVTHVILGHSEKDSILMKMIV